MIDSNSLLLPVPHAANSRKVKNIRSNGLILCMFAPVLSMASANGANEMVRREIIRADLQYMAALVSAAR